MSTVYETITLKNGEDVVDARRKRLMKAEIRQLDIKVLVDTGAHSALILPMAVCVQLGLPTVGTEVITVAGGAKRRCYLVGPIELWWHKRKIMVYAMVLPGENESILGITSLELLDLSVDPTNGVLFGVHGKKKLLSVK
jgi:clan AA aspartic protease